MTSSQPRNAHSPTPGQRGQPAVFFDRDGIVNRSPGPGYVERLEDFHLQPGFVEALRMVRTRHHKAIVVTNQRGMARGLVTQATITQLHQHLAERLAAENLHLDAIYVCPHERDSCTCRKPLPGMLLQAAREHEIDLSRSWMVGDHETDILAGQRAGCRTIRVGGHEPDSEADFRLADMFELADFFHDRLTSPATPHAASQSTTASPFHPSITACEATDNRNEVTP